MSRQETFSITIERKINLGKYETETIRLTTHNINFEISPSELDQLQDTQDYVIERMRESMRRRVAAIRREDAPDISAFTSSPEENASSPEENAEAPEASLPEEEPDEEARTVSNISVIAKLDNGDFQISCARCGRPSVFDAWDVDTNPDFLICQNANCAACLSVLAYKLETAAASLTTNAPADAGNEPLVDPLALNPAETSENRADAPEISAQAANSGGPETDAKHPPATNTETDTLRTPPDTESPIPDASEVPMTMNIFGVELPLPLEAWEEEPITQINSDGTPGGGQLKAVNAALTGIKCGGKLRHAAAQAIIDARWGTRNAKTVTSMLDLNKAEAHIILSWIDAAKQENLDLLADAMGIPSQSILQNMPERNLPVVAEPEPKEITNVEADEIFNTPTEPKIELSRSQQEALDACLEATSGFFFITGKAGTGKSTILRILREKRKCLVCAPTGLAALNVRGVTIHRQFKLKIGPLTRSLVPALYGADRGAVEACDAIVIDEVSMVRADTMDAINWSLQKTLGNDEPFGGKLVIAFGDNWQLEPVVGKSDVEQAMFKPGGEYNSHFWFDAKVFRGDSQALIVSELPGIIQYELTDVFRQAGNPEFIEALNFVRQGNPAGLDYINKRFGIEPDPEDMPVSITFTNDRAQAINDARLRKIEGEEKQYFASVDGDIAERDYPAPATLKLKVGAQVMVIANMQDEWGSFVANGSVGEVTEMRDSLVIVTLKDGRVVRCASKEWSKIAYSHVEQADGKKGIQEDVKATFSQIPLKLAWAITAHKAQGQTLDAAVLELERDAFGHGQTYVVLSRVKGFEALYLRRRVTASDLIVNKRVKEFCQPRQLALLNTEAFK